MSVKSFRERSPVLIGLLSLAALAAGTTFAFSLDKVPWLKQVYEIKAEFADAAGIVADNQVRVAGVKVGTVKDVALVGDRVVVTMEIDNGIEIPADTTADIKLATILGTKFVNIDASGGGPLMEAGDTIPLERTTVPYEIYQAANQGTKVLEDLDGQALNDMLVELTRLTKVTQDEVGRALAGFNKLGTGLNAKEQDLRALLSGAEDLTGLLAEEGPDIVRLIDASNEVLGSLARKREEVQSLLEATKVMAGDLESLIRTNRGNVDAILTKLHRALVVLESNVEHLDMAMEYAGPSSRYFASIFTQGPWGDIYVCALVLSATCEHD